MKKLLCLSLFALFLLSLAGKEAVRFAPKVNSPRTIRLDAGEQLLLAPGTFEVVLPPQSTPTAKYAAKLLAATLGKVLNCQVPVVSKGTGETALHVGDTALAAQLKLDLNVLDRDGFYIRTAGKKVLLAL